jgi:hypothetical protein
MRHRMTQMKFICVSSVFHPWLLLLSGLLGDQILQGGPGGTVDSP